MNIFKTTVLFIGCAATVYSNAALAGPFTVSSTGVSGTTSIKVGTQVAEAEIQDKIDLPSAEFSAGVAPDLAVKIKSVYRVIDSTNEPNESGFSDFEVSSKWNFLKASAKTHGIAMAIEPVIRIPSGNASRGLGSDEFSYTIPLILGYSSGDWELGSEFGLTHVSNQSNDSGYLGVLAMRRLSSTFKMGGELIFQSPDAKFNQFETQANVGIQWAVFKNAEVQALIGKSLNAPGDTKSNVYKLAIEFKL